jgi:hypothetical protein
VGDIQRGIHRVGAVRAVSRNFGIVGYDKREALTIDDMPVEHIELVLSVSRRAKENQGIVDTHVNPGHRVERALDVRQREATASSA